MTAPIAAPAAPAADDEWPKETAAQAVIKDKAIATLAGKLGIKDATRITISTGNRNMLGTFALRVAGLADNDNGENAEPEYPVTIRIESALADMRPDEAEKQLRATLAQIPTFASRLQTEEEKEHVSKVGDTLKSLLAGTELATSNLLEWAGFSPKTTDRWGIRDYALSNTEITPYGITFGLTMPAAEGDKAEEEAKIADQNIEKRLPAIREALCERMLHYTRENLAKEGKGEPEIEQALAQARKQFESLKFHVNREDGWEGGVRVSIRSPEQEAALEKAGPQADRRHGQQTDKADLLKASNPLHALHHSMSKDTPNPQLHKALGRAFLFAGEGAMDIFPKIAGRLDMRFALADIFADLAAKHPEKKQALDAVLADNLFKERWVKEDKTRKPTLEIVKEEAGPGQSHGSIVARFTLPNSQIGALFRELAASRPGQSHLQAANSNTALDAAAGMSR